MKPQELGPYNKSEVYSTKINELAIELKKECYANGIPMFFAAAIKNEGAETIYIAEHVSAAGAGCSLSNDKMPHFVNILNGFAITTPQLEMTELEL